MDRHYSDEVRYAQLFVLDYLYWTLVASDFLTAAILFLYQHHGRQMLNSRESRMRQGPELFEKMPSLSLRPLRGNTSFQLGEQNERPVFVFIASTTCTVCAKAREAFAVFAEKYRTSVDMIFLCRGNFLEVTEFTRSLPESVRVVPDPKWDIGTKLRISSTPFAFILDSTATVRGKGMPADLETFEWFITQIIDETNSGNEQSESLNLPNVEFNY